jgi:hypothetical protein
VSIHLSFRIQKIHISFKVKIESIKYLCTIPNEMKLTFKDFGCRI